MEVGGSVVSAIWELVLPVDKCVYMETVRDQWSIYVTELRL